MRIEGADMKHFRQGTIMGFGETWTRRKSTQNLKHPHTSELEANVRVVYVSLGLVMKII